MIIAIDASRSRSGGTIAHLEGILLNVPEELNDLEVHIWSYPQCLDALPDRQWLHKHSPSFLEKSIFHQLFWQKFLFPSEIRNNNCQVLFKTTASSVCNFEPSASLSQDMLPFEPGETKRFGYSIARIRLKILQKLYIKSLRSSNLAIFLTHYAARMIQKSTGKINNYRVIPHGVPDFFRIKKETLNQKKFNKQNVIKIIYISEISPYKHQDKVLQAISELNSSGYKLTLDLVGGGRGSYYKKFKRLLKKCDPQLTYTKLHPFIKRDQLPSLIQNSDIFIFASSCENLPITILEGMGSGKPIASSDRGPMPEVLGDTAFYFDPEDIQSIKDCIIQIVDSPDIVFEKVLNSMERSEKYNWKKCSHDTFFALSSLIKDNTH